MINPPLPARGLASSFKRRGPGSPPAWDERRKSTILEQQQQRQQRRGDGSLQNVLQFSTREYYARSEEGTMLVDVVRLGDASTNASVLYYTEAGCEVLVASNAPHNPTRAPHLSLSPACSRAPRLSAELRHRMRTYFPRVCACIYAHRSLRSGQGRRALCGLRGRASL